MASSSCPIMSVHDINFSEEVLDFARYDNNNIGNVQVAKEGGELEIPKVVDVKRHDVTYITKMH
jgi:hypothetical protein